MSAAGSSQQSDGARACRPPIFRRPACPPVHITRGYRKGLPRTALEENCTKSPTRCKAGWKSVTSPADNLTHRRHLAEPCLHLAVSAPWADLRKDDGQCHFNANEARPPFVTGTERERTS